jgi:hypothetical protein
MLVEEEVVNSIKAKDPQDVLDRFKTKPLNFQIQSSVGNKMSEMSKFYATFGHFSEIVNEQPEYEDDFPTAPVKVVRKIKKILPLNSKRTLTKLKDIG